MSVYAPLLGNLWLTIESYGVDPRSVVDESLYKPGKPTLFEERIAFSDYDRMLARAVSLIEDPAIGLRSSGFLHPSHLGALGHAWLASSTLRSAFLRAERYGRMFNEQVSMSVEELHGRLRLSYRMLVQPASPDPLYDSLLASLLKLARFNFGPGLKPLQVDLERRKPDDPQAWYEMFGDTVRFGSSDNALAFRISDVDKPLTGSNSELVAVHEEVIKRHLLKLDRQSVANHARIKLMDQLPSGRVTEEDLANSLNMSKRTLHRKLRDQGTTFRSLLTQVRKDLARFYIQNLDYSITEIAFLLGYADISAFSRAFKSWFGQTPTELRTQTVAAKAPPGNTPHPSVR